MAGQREGEVMVVGQGDSTGETVAVILRLVPQHEGNFYPIK